MIDSGQHSMALLLCCCSLLVALELFLSVVLMSVYLWLFSRSLMVHFAVVAISKMELGKKIIFSFAELLNKQLKFKKQKCNLLFSQHMAIAMNLHSFRCSCLQSLRVCPAAFQFCCRCARLGSYVVIYQYLVRLCVVYHSDDCASSMSIWCKSRAVRIICHPMQSNRPATLKSYNFRVFIVIICCSCFTDYLWSVYPKCVDLPFKLIWHFSPAYHWKQSHRTSRTSLSSSKCSMQLPW